MRTALITGASSGIGLELARVFARERWDLVLVSRNLSRLDALASELSNQYGISAQPIAQDLSDPEAPSALFEEIQRRSLRIDALVNNAGIGSFGPFMQIGLERDIELLEINVMSLTKLTKLFLAPMLERREGYVLNVASTAAFQPGPLMAVYYASKAYVLSLSEALAYEVRGSGVSVSALCPGATATDFQERAQMTRSKLFRRNVMRADVVAEAGYRGMMQRKAVILPGLANKLIANSSRFAPRSVVVRIVRKVQEAAT